SVTPACVGWKRRTSVPHRGMAISSSWLRRPKLTTWTPLIVNDPSTPAVAEWQPIGLHTDMNAGIGLPLSSTAMPVTDTDGGGVRSRARSWICFRSTSPASAALSTGAGAQPATAAQLKLNIHLVLFISPSMLVIH